MKILAVFATFILTLPLQLNAQHYIATKGERVDYDTAIVIQVQTYKEEIAKQKAQQRMLDSLRYQVLDLQSQPVVLPPNNYLTREELALELEKLRQDMPRYKWYHNPLLYIGVGALLGVFFID